MNLTKLALALCLLLIVQGKFISQPNNFNISLTLSKSIFDNYYCGNVDGFPHFKLKYGSNCENNVTHQIGDREFWNDGTSPSTFFYLYNYLNLTNSDIPNDFQTQVNELINDWDITQIRNILLWDKLKVKDRYGVGNDDRLWYAISFMQIQSILGHTNPNQQYYQLAVEIFEWVTDVFENNICGGGVFWDIEKAYKNSITNHLYIDLSVYLYEYSSNANYMNQAKVIADWELNQGNLLDSDYLFFDGAYNKKICKNLNKDKWTYNQGVFMRGYLALSTFFSDPKYENVVYQTIITMTQNKQSIFRYFKLSSLSQNPLQYRPYSTDPNYIVLLEYQNQKYSETTATFKGIFMRYLGSAYSHALNSFTSESETVKKSIEKYVIDNVNYIYSLSDSKNSYPFYWNQTTPVDQQTFTAGTSTTVLDLFALYDLINKSN